MFNRPRKTGLYDPAFEHESCGVGFVAHMKGIQSHSILTDAHEVLRNMDHRGAVGADANSGDGAGILTALPDQFMRRVAREELKQSLPPSGRFGAGLVFLPQDLGERQRCQTTIESLISEYGQELVGWRLVPLRPDLAKLGDSAKASEPHIEQIIIAASAELSDKEFERKDQ